MRTHADLVPRVRETDVVDAMRGEERLLAQLVSALEAQRAGIAANDVGAVEAATRAVSRLILTLDEARRHRERIARELARHDEDYEGMPPMRPAIVEGRELVRRMAERVSSELAINQRILSRALKAGDAYLQALFSTVATPASGYNDGARLIPVTPRGVAVNARG